MFCSRMQFGVVVASVSLAGMASRSFGVGQTVTLTAPGVTGGYSWFSDERGRVDGNKLVTGWITTDGRVQATTYDLTTTTQTTTDLDTGFGVDTVALRGCSGDTVTAHWVVGMPTAAMQRGCRGAVCDF